MKPEDEAEAAVAPPQRAHLRSDGHGDCNSEQHDANLISPTTNPEPAHELSDLKVSPSQSSSAAGRPSAITRSRSASSVRFPTNSAYHRFRRFWERHVSIKVDPAGRRDHLALERTFLGYLRTSLALSMMGVVIAQLLRLNAVQGPDGMPVGGVPLAGACVAGSLVVVLTGAVRFWRQQGAMVKGKVWAGGAEVWVMWGVVAAVS